MLHNGFKSTLNVTVSVVRGGGGVVVGGCEGSEQIKTAKLRLVSVRLTFCSVNVECYTTVKIVI